MNATEFDKEKFLHPPIKEPGSPAEDISLSDVMRISRKYTAALSAIVDDLNNTMIRFNEQKEQLQGVELAMLLGEATAVARLSEIVRKYAG